MDPARRFPIPDPWLGDEARAFARSVQRWADERVIAERPGRQDDPAGLAAQVWPALVDELGLGRTLWPEALGGLGGGSDPAALTLTAAAEQVGRADLGLGLDLAVGQALAAGCTLDPQCPDAVRVQAKRWLLPEGTTALAAWVGPSLARLDANLERPAGLEGLAAQASAERLADGWVLSGRGVRPWSSGAAAQVFGVVAGVEEAPDGLGLFVVPADATGLGRKEALLRVGLDGCPNAPVELDRVRLPEAACLGLGVAPLRRVQTWLHLLASAAVVGAMLYADELTADWGENRVIKGRGQRLVDNPLCASLMGELADLTSAARVQVYAAACLVAAPGDCDDEAVWLSTRSTAVEVLGRASQGLGRVMELMGSAGYAREWNLERCWRDVRCLRGLLGTPALSRLALARRLYGSGA